MKKIHIVNLFIKHPTENKILCVKRAKEDRVFGNMYALPGGKIEENENLKEAAKRELFEETGVKLKELDIVPFIISPLKIGENTYNIGLYNAKIESEKFEPHDKDIEKVEYIRTSELLESLRINRYPNDQIKVFENYFTEKGFM